MISFLIALAVLVGGYFIYGALMERICGVDSRRPTPAYTKTDGIDYIPLPTWKVFLIQFLNIAGLGPIFGAIMGIMFGPAAFLWIVFGTIFAGAVHDFFSGMMSLRSGGASLPEIVGEQLGLPVRQVMRIFSILLLILVAAVFVITPAGLLDGMTGGGNAAWWIAAIFTYYMLATLLPINKIIGNLYPVFGLSLLFMAAALLWMLLFTDIQIPDGFADGLHSRNPGYPIFPMMFVSIACGAISGFHATQSPMMARCLKNERLARPIFYGAMVAEGLVALIWAAAAIAFTGGYAELGQYMQAHGTSAGALVNDVSVTWLGTFGGILVLLGVIMAPITTGDTALRSVRIIASDMLRFDQRKFWRRIALSLPIFALTYLVMCIDFSVLWRYFAWCNQTLAVFTLWAITVWLARHGRAFIVSLLPAMFMTAVSVTYLLFAPTPEGLGMPITIATAAGATGAVVLLFLFLRWQRTLKKNGPQTL